LGACGGGADRSAPRSALLITLDTTRRDALDCYSGRRGLTPELSRLAAEGTVYDWARATAPLTLPSHASMLTGLYPPRHTVRANSIMALPDSARTLAELASERGIETAAFVSAVVLASEFRLDQGFQTYAEPANSARPTRHYDRQPAGEIVDAALGWLGRRDPERPFFCWLHFFDPHKPYEAPPEYLAKAGGNAYLAEVAYTDHEIGRFLEALRQSGAYADTTILVVADHGEAQSEHGEEGHGPFVYDSTLRVPFLLSRANGARAGERSDEIVSVVDVYPTLAEALGLPLQGDVDGHSLYGGKADPTRGVYFESFLGYIANGWSPISGWADGEGKYIHSPSPEFYAVAGDPGETRNRASERAGLLPSYRERIDELARAPSLSSALVAGDAEKLMRDLQALGYSGAGIAIEDLPDPLEDTERPSPHQRIEDYARFQTARTLVQENRPADALPLLEALVAATPLDHSSWFQLGAALRHLGRFGEALAPLQRNLELRGSWRGVEVNLGLCYEALGQSDRAIQHFARAIEHEPRWVEIREKLIRLLESAGRSAEADRYRSASTPSGSAPGLDVEH
jgi:arylsulfatase A-like enzyme